MLIAQNLTSQIKFSEFTVTMLPSRRLTGSVAGTGARSRSGTASDRAQRFRDLRLSLSLRVAAAMGPHRRSNAEVDAPVGDCDRRDSCYLCFH